MGACRVKASIAVGCDGLMLEFHPDPTNAAVDPLQPLNFNQISSLIPELQKVASAAYNKKLA